jgi:peptidoglycan/LPS O-acetylase OafA/YrhL
MRAGQEIRALTGLRGVAAIYVAIFHYLVGLLFAKPATTPRSHDYFSVNSCFVLSDFFVALDYKHMFQRSWSVPIYLKLLGRRFGRYPPFVFPRTRLRRPSGGPGLNGTAPTARCRGC